MMNKEQQSYVWFGSNLLWSEMGLVMCVLSGVMISLVSNNVFLVWVGLELKMFGMIPILSSNPTQTKKTLLLTNKETKVSFYYFFVQIMGSLLFGWGFVLGDWTMISLMGLLLKLGATPFFWWVPPLFSRLDWISMGILSTMQKIPGVLLMRLMFDLKLKSCIIVSISGLMVASMGINFSFKNLKSLMAWSSISKMSILMLLMVLNSSYGLMYYVFYSMVSLMFCLLLSETDISQMCKSFMNGSKMKVTKLMKLLLLMFSGLPPLMSFVLKMYFLGGLYKKDLKSSGLGSWNLVLSFLFLITLQSVGYIKAFMSMNSTGSSRLSFMSKCKYWVFKSFYLGIMMLYLLSMVLIWT